MRKQGWEQQLEKTIEEARNKPYALGQHDCFSLACAVVAALTGRDHWPEFVGKYSTFEEAIALIHAWGPTFEEAFDQLTGEGRMAKHFQRRGDIGCYKDARGIKHLGICVGALAALMSEEGLVFVPAEELDPWWRIG